MAPPPTAPRFPEQLARLRQTNNVTNFFFIARAWLIIVGTLGVFVGFDLFRAAADWHWAWDFPVLVFAVIVIGASQHQLAGAGHEATHRTLFNSPRLNEMISDWFCMFPILTTTATYRKQHLPHHQFVNDPDRDPDLAQLGASGHDFAFPMGRRELIRSYLRQLWPPNLIRYTLHRIRYSAIGVESGEALSPLPDRLFFPYFFLLFASMGLLAHLEMPPWTFLAAAGLLGGVATLAICLSARKKESVPPADSVIPPRTTYLLRYGHLTLVLLGATLIHVYTGLETLTYLALLWFVPLGTSFSYFMMLRQSIQHGNCDSGKYTNTRVFLVNPLFRYAVFPFGMDYHLPHHLYATVPHYRLRDLHELLEEEPDYRTPGHVASGCFHSPSTETPRLPTVADVLGPPKK